MSGDRTFTVASDESLTALISQAKEKLVVIAPGLNKAVVQAIEHQLR